MSNAGTLAVTLTADNAGFIAKMAEAGTITEREAGRMQRQLKYINDQLRIQASAQKAANDAVGGGSASAQRFVASQQQVQRSIQGLTISSAQAANAMRMLPAQMTDVFTQLAGGASPMLVLIQQGGQVKDMFGGVGNTFRALGSALSVGRVAMGLTAVAAAGVAYEMYRGQKESEDFARAIQKTGNYAAITEARLSDMAKAESLRNGRGLEDNRSTINTLAGTGLFGVDTVQDASRAMAAYQRITGETADEAVKDFTGIADGAAKWAASQNRSMHFMTAAQYEHIKALDDAGKHTQAIQEALKLMATEMESRSVPQVGYLGTAWKAVTEYIDSAKRALMDWGKDDTPDAMVTKLRQRIADAQDSVDAGKRYGSKDVAQRQAVVDALQERLREVQRFAQREQEVRVNAAKAAERENDKITKLQQAKKAASPDYLGQTEDGFRKRIEQWAEANQNALDKVEGKLAGFEMPKQLLDDFEAVNRTIESLPELRLQGLGRQLKALDSPEFFGLDLAQVEKARRQVNDEILQIKASMGSLAFDEGAQMAAAKWWASFNNEGQRGADMFTNTFKGMEDAVVNWAKTGKLSASNFFGSMAEEYIRQTVRMAQAKLFFDKDGGFTGLSGLGDAVSAGASFLGFGHKNGLDYVPYDGYPAILHEGERVQTAIEARGGSSGGQVINVGQGQVINVGQGVSRGEVVAAVVQANAATKADILRTLRLQGGV